MSLGYQADSHHFVPIGNNSHPFLLEAKSKLGCLAWLTGQTWGTRRINKKI